MIRAEALAAACVGHGWGLLLTFTLTLLVVGVLRKPCRRAFGAERSLQLWLIPPLAMLVTQLPRFALVSSTFALAPGMVTWAAAALPMAARSTRAPGLAPGMLVLWFVGMVATLGLAWRAQRRFRSRLQNAVIVTGADARWPVLRAAHADVGPALVGAWRVQIVLPFDFEQRYDAVERALILAHESAHADRRDGVWSLLAQIVCAVFWFHPLAWIALLALRLDQELACDALVLRRNGACRRRYASALLKTQAAALSLPVGCSWSPRHPVTERIAMLRVDPPVRSRRLAGALSLGFLLAGVTGSAYALSQSGKPGTDAAGLTAPGREYQLDIYAQKSTGAVSGVRIERANLALCTAVGKPGSFTLGDWKVRTVVVAAGANGVRVDLSLGDANDIARAQSQGTTPLAQALHADLVSPDGTDHFAFVVTPLSGCPAREEADPKHAEQVSSAALALPGTAARKS